MHSRNKRGEKKDLMKGLIFPELLKNNNCLNVLNKIKMVIYKNHFLN